MSLYSSQVFNQENLDFQEKVLLRSGLGEETYLPECEWGFRAMGQGNSVCGAGGCGAVWVTWQNIVQLMAVPPRRRPVLPPSAPVPPCSHHVAAAQHQHAVGARGGQHGEGGQAAASCKGWGASRQPVVPHLVHLRCCGLAMPPALYQAAPRTQPRLFSHLTPPLALLPTQVLFACVEEALKATGTKPQAVDILIVNCSLFNPTPSLSGACRLVGGAARLSACLGCGWLQWWGCRRSSAGPVGCRP